MELPNPNYRDGLGPPTKCKKCGHDGFVFREALSSRPAGIPVDAAFTVAAILCARCDDIMAVGMVGVTPDGVTLGLEAFALGMIAKWEAAGPPQ